MRSKIHPKISKKIAHTQKYQINYLMRSIQNFIIECNKLRSHSITGKPPKVFDHNVNPHPKFQMDPLNIEGSSDPLGPRTSTKIDSDSVVMPKIKTEI